jgi:hypothetical protein
MFSDIIVTSKNSLFFNKGMTMCGIVLTTKNMAKFSNGQKLAEVREIYLKKKIIRSFCTIP